MGAQAQSPAEQPSHIHIYIYDMGSRMKTTLNIDDTGMAELKREATRQGRTMSELVDVASTAHLSTKARENPRPTKVPQRRSTRRYCRPTCPIPRYGRSLVLAVDSNVLVYAADAEPRLARTPTGATGCMVHHLGDPL
jgi:hypothetical protein